jgi:ketosteroid isomerase-like protein
MMGAGRQNMRWAGVVLICVVAAFGQGQAAPEAEFSRLETVWNEAHIKGDPAALERLWSDDLEVAVPRMPILTKSTALQFARSGRMRFERYETSELKVRKYGDTAVVTGRLQRTRTIEGKRMDDDWRFTKVYARQGGEWRVVTFHASEAAQP